MRAAIYTRISRDEAGDGLGVQRQEDDCRDLCSRRGWTVSAVYTDNDTSAYSGRKRAGYLALSDAISRGAVDAVVAWAPERLHRSPRELEDFLELIERSGCSVETVKAGAWDVSTSHGRLVARMLGAVSRAESERTGERVSRAHQQAKASGRWRGPIPFGMRSTSVPGLPEPDPRMAPIAVDILTRVRRGDALTKIASNLNAQGVLPRRGKAWTHSGIARLIACPALGGLVDVSGELQEAAFEGVVSAEEWRSARAAVRRRPRSERSRPRESLSLLGGILTCYEHGSTCFAGSGGPTRTYGSVVPGRCFVSMSRQAADAIVSELVICRLRSPDAADLFRPHESASTLDQEIAEQRRRREEIADLLAEGLLSAAIARPRLAQIVETIGELEARRSPNLVSPTDLIDPAIAWAEWTITQRREVIRALFDTLAIRHVGHKNGPRADPSRLVVRWRTEAD